MTPLDELLCSQMGGKPYFVFNHVSFSDGISNKYAKFGKAFHNPMTSETYRYEILEAFSKIQRFIHAIYRLRNLWRFRRAKVYNTDDLFMTPIQSTDKHVLVVFENDTKYLFPLRELIRVVQTSLSHCAHFFPDPQLCKNPYTNLPFHKSTLYQIYFAIRGSAYAMPALFENFFRMNFHYNQFWNQNEEFINQEFLKTYVENNCVEGVLEHVLDMFKHHGFRLPIHDQFPKDVLFQIMKPYLSLFYESHYSLNTHRQARATRILHRKLHRFMAFNPTFGRKKASFVSDNPFSTVKRCIYTFNKRCPPFQIATIDDFLTTHLDDPVPSSSSAFTEGISLARNNEDSESDETETDDDDPILRQGLQYILTNDDVEDDDS